jgi:hypothetical protein
MPGRSTVGLRPGDGTHALLQLFGGASFKTTPTDERLFFQGGFWSRPYIMPDAETERRTNRKVNRSAFAFSSPIPTMALAAQRCFFTDLPAIDPQA